MTSITLCRTMITKEGRGVANVARACVKAPDGPQDRWGFERLLKKFRWRVEKAGILNMCKDAAVYEKPSQRRHRERRCRAG